MPVQLSSDERNNSNGLEEKFMTAVAIVSHYKTNFYSSHSPSIARIKDFISMEQLRR